MAGPGRTLEAGLLIGVGAAFDFHSGRIRQAPRWMQRCGLEWLFRLCREPRRLGPRYVSTNTMFVLRLAAQKLGIRRYPIGYKSSRWTIDSRLTGSSVLRARSCMTVSAAIWGWRESEQRSSAPASAS